MIKKLYYLIWTDCILQTQKSTGTKKYWRSWSLFLMSFCFGFNYVPILFLLPKSLDPLVSFREFHFFSSDFLDTLLHGLILFYYQVIFFTISWCSTKKSMISLLKNILFEMVNYFPSICQYLFFSHYQY